jgi:hypothetical protein
MAKFQNQEIALINVVIKNEPKYINICALGEIQTCDNVNQCHTLSLEKV